MQRTRSKEQSIDKPIKSSTSKKGTAASRSAKASDKAAVLQKVLAQEQALITEESLTKLESDEREYARELARMFRYLKKLRRKLERDCLDGSAGNRGVYALCTVMSQQREVISDIRAITDLSGQVMLVDEQVLQPMVRTVGQTLLNAYYQLRKLTTEIADKKQTQFGLDQVEKIITDLSGTLQSQYENAQTQTHRIFVGEESMSQQPKKKRR